jgi:hypothetical protein
MGGAETLRQLELPESSSGAPLPHVLADEHRLTVIYLAQVLDPEWDGTTVRVVSPASDEPCVVVRFDLIAFTFGPPNDEAIAGHRLAKEGLAPYGSYEVINSRWIANLEKANRVHHNHTPESFAGYRHFILTFHDSTLEVVSDTEPSAEVVPGPLRRVLAAEAGRT